jgi:hypothetical protein
MEPGAEKQKVLGWVMLIVGVAEALFGSWVGLRGGSSRTEGVALAFGAALALFGGVLVWWNRR